MYKGIAFPAALALGLPIAPAAAAAPKAVSGPEITIEIVNANGSGCALNTAAVTIADDLEAFTVTYGDYAARAGGSSDPADARKNCQVTLKVHVPKSFTWGISQVDYRVFADLQSGAKATQRAAYFFQNSWPTKTTTVNVSGPHEGLFQLTDQVPVDQIVWKPCDEERTFTLNTELRVDKGASDPSKISTISLNSSDNARTTYHLAWKRCL